jgi:hypothetical protein
MNRMMKTLKSRELTSEKDGGRKEGAARSRDFMCSYSCSDLAGSAFKRGYPLPSLHKTLHLSTALSTGMKRYQYLVLYWQAQHT